MKHLMCLVCAVVMFVSTTAQTLPLQLATNKTTSLIFPFPIRYVDRGTKDVIVQQVPAADNLLLVKAAIEKFAETNLSVVTGDGAVYSFRLLYNAEPDSLVYHIAVDKKESIATYCMNITDNRRTVAGIFDRRFGMQATIDGIYIKDHVLYFQLAIQNEGAIDYDIDLLQFYIRDKKRNKRTAVQENEVTPLHVAGNIHKVKSYQRNVIVVALEKFTIPDGKYFAVQLLEKNGGRHLQLKVKNKKVIRAITLPGLH